MLPIIELFDKPAEGAAITFAGSREPVMVVPFPRETLVGAFPIDAGTVLFVGSRYARDGGKERSTLLAIYDHQQRRAARRAELRELRSDSAIVSVDRQTLYLMNFSGITVVDTESLSVRRCMQLYRTDGDGGAVTSFEALDGKGPAYSHVARDRWETAKEGGWRQILITSQSILQDLDPDCVAQVHLGWHSTGSEPRMYWQQYDVFDWRRGSAKSVIFRGGVEQSALDLFDPNASLLYASRRLLGIFLPSDRAREQGLKRPDGSAASTTDVILWRIGEPETEPWVIQVRDGADKKAALRKVYEDPRDGVLWLSFEDGCIRSLDDEGRLGPLVVLSDGSDVRSRASQFVYACPVVTFQGAAEVVAEKGHLMARHVFRTADLAEKIKPVHLMPVKSGPLSRRHAKDFAAYVRGRRRDRFALPDWSRDSVAAVLDAQRAAIEAGLAELVDEEDRLTFGYKVAGKPVKESAFFRRIARDLLPVVPELRALLLAYTDALSAGGEGVQPWQNPDEGVGGLGSALQTLALLNPDGIDVLRAYLETRNGEHEAFCLNVVVPAFFKRHGWRDAAVVRFCIYATLNRFWGGRRPAEGFGEMWEALPRLLTPGETAEAVLNEAEHFGRKGDFGHDAAAYRAAFRSLLDPALPFEAAVRDALKEAPPMPAG